jgi:hypothetical protein
VNNLKRKLNNKQITDTQYAKLLLEGKATCRKCRHCKHDICCDIHTGSVETSEICKYFSHKTFEETFGAKNAREYMIMMHRLANQNKYG